MSPQKSRLRKQKATPKCRKSPRTPKQRSFQCRTPSSVSPLNNSQQFLWQSQEVHDGITWDYRSPLQLKLRSAKQYGKAGVNDLLKYIDHEAEKGQRTSLLDTWISAGQTMISPILSVRRKSESGRKKTSMRKSSRPRHLAKELQELSEAIKKGSNKEEETRLLYASEHSAEIVDLKMDNTDGLCDENSVESSEELWGADSESFLIQATQVTEQAEDEYVSKQLLQGTSVPLCDVNKERVPCNGQTVDTGNKTASFGTINEKSTKESQTLLKDFQIAKSSDNNDRKVTCQIGAADFWEDDNSFDDILSSLPYDELTVNHCAKENANNVVSKVSPSIKCSVSSSRNNFTLKKSNGNTSMNSFESCHPDKISHERKSKNDDKKCLIISDKKSPLYCAISSLDLQAATIEWESDEFDEVLMQAEILNAVEQAESEALGSQKCTPEEIARKKAEALERRKRNRVNALSTTNFGKQQFIWKDRLRSKVIDVSKQQKL